MPIVVHLDVMLAKRKMRSRELAERVGITEQNISLLKSGKVRGVRFDTLEAICLALDCQPGDLLSYEPEAAMQATASPAEFRPAPGWRRGWLGVLALHLALLGLWRQALHRPKSPPPAAQAPLVWLTVPGRPAGRGTLAPHRPAAPARQARRRPGAAVVPRAPQPLPGRPSRRRLFPPRRPARLAGGCWTARPPGPPSARRHASLLSERAASATGIAPRTGAAPVEGSGRPPRATACAIRRPPACWPCPGWRRG
jgi:putative transcriptional regulator